MVGDWISVRSLAELSGLTRQASHKALARVYAGETLYWRDAELKVRLRHGRGGRSGRQYEVAVDSLPNDLRTAFEEASKAPLALERVRTDSAVQADRNWWLTVLQPAMAHPKGSAERRAAVEAIAMGERPGLDGRPRRVSEATIYTKLADYDAGGIAALGRRRRADAGIARFHISKVWDQAVPFTDPKKREIADLLRLQVRGYYIAGAKQGEIERGATLYLVQVTRDYGFRPNVPGALEAVCKVPKAFILAERSARRAGEPVRDAKRAHDKLPAIIRTTRGMQPMDCIVMDVHTLNVLLPRENGDTATPFWLSIMDIATRRTFPSGLMLIDGKGGVRNSDQVRVFMEMLAHPAWGLPKMIHIDNGSEYFFADFLNEAMRLNVQHECIPYGRDSHVIRALPYNAQSKPIEAVFGHFENGFVSSLQGYIGDNRMKPMQAKVGKLPAPFPGGMDAFAPVFFGLLQAYDNTPQTGALKGLSPAQSFARHVADGWAATVLDTDARDFLTVFRKPVVRTLRKHVFKWRGRTWACDELFAFLGDRVTIHVPAFDFQANELLVEDMDGNAIGVTRPDVEFDYLDPNGAEESAKRKAITRSAQTAVRKNTPKVDRTAKHLEFGAQAIPVTPNPPAGVIRLDDHRPTARVIDPAEPEAPDEVPIADPPVDWPLDEYDRDRAVFRAEREAAARASIEAEERFE